MADGAGAGEGMGARTGSGYAKKSYRKQLSDLQHAKPLTGSSLACLFVYFFACLLDRLLVWLVWLVGLLAIVMFVSLVI